MWYRLRTMELIRLHTRWEQFKLEALNGIALREDSSGSYTADGRRLRQKATIRNRLPILDLELKEYALRIRSIVRLCRKAGVRPVLLTQPALYSDQLSERSSSLLCWGYDRDGNYLTVAALSQSLSLLNKTLIDVSNGLSANCIDLSSMNGREEFFYDDCHFTEAGATEVARQVAAWFIDHQRKIK